MDISRFKMVDNITQLDIELGFIECDSRIYDDEEVFNYHFPQKPVLPGVFLIELMAQASAYLILAKMGVDKLPFLVSVDKSKFKNFNRPGDVLEVKSVLLKSRCNVFYFDCEIFNAGKLSARSTLRMGLMDYPAGKMLSKLEIESIEEHAVKKLQVG